MDEIEEAYKALEKCRADKRAQMFGYGKMLTEEVNRDPILKKDLEEQLGLTVTKKTVLVDGEIVGNSPPSNGDNANTNSESINIDNQSTQNAQQLEEVE